MKPMNQVTFAGHVLGHPKSPIEAAEINLENQSGKMVKTTRDDLNSSEVMKAD